jgi:rSAM/selenodomain-associated transferase 2
LDRLISVIIPTLNEAAALGDTLDHLARIPGRWEVIVADSGSADRTLAIARERDAIVVEGAPAGRGAAMNAGAARASGDILLFLHADTCPPDTAYRLISEALASPGVAAAAFRLRMDRDEWRFRMLTPVATLRFRIQRAFFGDQAIAVRKADFERVGGYHEPLLMEDVDLSRRFRKLGRLELLPAHVLTSARRFERHGVARTLALMSVFQAAYMLGVPADQIERWYGHVRRLEQSDAAPTTIDLDGLTFEDADGRVVQLADLGHGPLLLVFLRWLG